MKILKKKYIGKIFKKNKENKYNTQLQNEIF